MVLGKHCATQTVRGRGGLVGSWGVDRNKDGVPNLCDWAGLAAR